MTRSHVHIFLLVVEGCPVILSALPSVSGSPGGSQSLHALGCSPQPGLPPEASEAANVPPVKPFGSSPSMPSLSSCAAGRSELCVLPKGPAAPRYSPAHRCCLSGLAETSKANGSSHSQDQFASLSQATAPTAHTQKGKGTFTDDLLQLVDNFARDAISLSQCKRGPKNGATAVLGHDVSTVGGFFMSNRDKHETSVH